MRCRISAEFIQHIHPHTLVDSEMGGKTVKQRDTSCDTGNKQCSILAAFAGQISGGEVLLWRPFVRECLPSPISAIPGSLYKKYIFFIENPLTMYCACND